MAKYISNRLKNLTIGLDSYSENLTSLNIIGDVKVGAGVTISSSAGIVTAVGFKKVGGTNSQFMMADGSVNSSTFLTAESDTLDTILNRGNTTTKDLTVGDITADNISVGGTITYNDVTNVDSIGIITARKSIHVGAGLSVAGISTFNNGLVINDTSPFLDFIQTSGTNSSNRYRLRQTSGELFVQISTNNGASYSNAVSIGGIGNIFIPDNDKVFFGSDNDAYIQHDNSNLNVINTTGKILITGITSLTDSITIGTGVTLAPNGNATFSGIVTATTFSGSGASLTNLPAGQLTGTLPAISGANLTDVMTTSGGSVGDLSVSGIASVGIGTTGDTFTGKVDLFHEGDIKLRTTPAGVQVIGILSATSLDFTGAEGAFSDDLLLQGGSANALWDRSESYLQFNDGAKAVFGTDVLDGDLEIFHSGSHSYISENGTGDLFIITGAVGLGSTAIKISDGSSTLYYQGAERLKTTSTGITLTGTLTADIEGNATTADKATDLAINATQQLVLQTGNNATDVLASGTAGYVLQSNGSGSAPTWAATAPANAITGITIREDGGLVGTANSVSTINFTGAGVGVTFTNPVAGIATVTIAGGGGDSSAVMLSMIFG